MYPPRTMRLNTMRLNLALASLAALSGTTARPAAAQVAHLVLQSQPGDFIGLGWNYDVTYTPANTDPGFFIAAAVPTTDGGPPTSVQFNFAQIAGYVNNDANLTFSSVQLKTPLSLGTYTNAQRAVEATAGHPGLDVGFQGRGSNHLAGNFTITNFTYDPTAPISYFGLPAYRLTSFNATFEQHSEGAAPALFGTISYQATGAPVPEASTTVSFGLLLALGAGGIVVAARRRKAGCTEAVGSQGKAACFGRGGASSPGPKGISCRGFLQPRHRRPLAAVSAALPRENPCPSPRSFCLVGMVCAEG